MNFNFNFIFIIFIIHPITDVLFFDESIDAKMNRYLFKLRSIDTPFLLDNANVHAKTYVPPTPNTEGLWVEKEKGKGEGNGDEQKEYYTYDRFPLFE